MRCINPLMQRCLVLLRHGESDWEGAPTTDHERALTEDGRGQAASAGNALAQHGWTPDHVVSSTAIRARQTAQLVVDAFGRDLVVTEDQALYAGGLGALQGIVGALGDDVCTAVIVGHNPSLSVAASVLSGSDVALPPGAAAWLQKDGATWEEAITEGGWTLVEVRRAKI